MNIMLPKVLVSYNNTHQMKQVNKFVNKYVWVREIPAEDI